MNQILKQLLLLMIFTTSTLSFSQNELVPKNYVAIKEAIGDLDNDGTPEKAVVFNMTDNPDEINGVKREIVIFKKVDEKWTIWQRSANAIGSSIDAGMTGDCLENIEIRYGVLLIFQSGGGIKKWTTIDKYQFQNNELELTGYSSYYGTPCEYWETFDFNINTGNIDFKVQGDNCPGGPTEPFTPVNESFNYKLKKKIILKNRRNANVKIICPKSKKELTL